MTTAIEATPTVEDNKEPYRSGNGRFIVINHDRDVHLTPFGKATLTDRYLLPGERYQHMFARVACAYSDDSAHAQRLYDYMSKTWFMPATPVLSNGGAARGLPISCFLSNVEDSLAEIKYGWAEGIDLASNGGGLGVCYSDVRSVGEKVGRAGETSGIVPFIKVNDSLTLGISQGSLRRGSAAMYLDVSHPEIEEFLELRKSTGDFNRKALNLHHGITIPDAFMEAVRDNREWELKSPKSGELIKTISARKLWQKILELRLQTGEPYLLFIDHVNAALPDFQKALGLKVKQSNLCSEITLVTGRDHHNRRRTAVCCLSSVNAEQFYEWVDDPLFIEDVMRFLDNVLQDFIDRAPSHRKQIVEQYAASVLEKIEGIDGMTPDVFAEVKAALLGDATHAIEGAMDRAIYSATRERSVGLGVMGFHSLLQAEGIPFESALAKSRNLVIARHLRSKADEASRKLAQERGACPDAAEAGIMERFAHKLAGAPTASISIICGGVSPAWGEPWNGNIFTQKTLSGSFTVKNRHLEQVLELYGRNTPETWEQILKAEGSVQAIDFLTEDEKATFKTAFEIDQRWIIEFAADRQQYVCQAVSTNLFIPADVHLIDLHMLHWMAWEKGVKSLYYCRSKSITRAAFAGGVESDNTRAARVIDAVAISKYEECLACQFSDVSRDRKPIFNVATVFIATLRVSVRKLEDLCNLALLRLRGNRKRVAVSGEALLVSA